MFDDNIMLTSPPPPPAAVCGTSGLMGTSVVSVQWEKVREQSSTSHSAKAPARGWKRSSSPRSTGRSCSQRRWWGCSTPTFRNRFIDRSQKWPVMWFSHVSQLRHSCAFCWCEFWERGARRFQKIDCRLLSQLWIGGLFAVIKSNDYVVV